MTVSGSTYKNTYTLDEATTVFPYEFKITEDSDMLVERYYSTDDTTTTVSSSLYSVSGAGNDSGTRNVTYAGATAYDSDYKLILSSNVPYTQPTDYVAGDDFAQDTHEKALDRLCIEIKQLKEATDRALKVAKNMSNPSDLSEIDSGYLYTDGTNWSLTTTPTTTETEYSGSIEAGTDASKSATPDAKDIYVSTDTEVLNICYDGTNWRKHYNMKIESGDTLTITDSSDNTIATIDENGNMKLKGTIETQGTF